MSSTSIPPSPPSQSESISPRVVSTHRGDELEEMPSGVRNAAIAWTSLLFAVLQSICTFFAALEGLRLAIGIGAVAVSSGLLTVFHGLHQDLVRVPMVIVSLAGAVLNLVVLWQIHRLRNRPAAQWRREMVPKGRIRMERVQLVLSIVTLVLLSIEEYWHFKWHHHL